MDDTSMVFRYSQMTANFYENRRSGLGKCYVKAVKNLFVDN